MAIAKLKRDFQEILVNGPSAVPGTLVLNHLGRVAEPRPEVGM